LPKTFRLHDLRHACATLLLLAGVHPKVVAERLGHSSLNKDRLVQIQERFGFKNPLEAREAEATDG
jgi:integrase